jgi:hypothetical protein
MARIKELFVECGFCGTKFNSKAFAETDALESALATGHMVDCPKCGKRILCNKSNTSYTLEESAGTGGIDFT